METLGRAGGSRQTYIKKKKKKLQNNILKISDKNNFFLRIKSRSIVIQNRAETLEKLPQILIDRVW